MKYENSATKETEPSDPFYGPYRIYQYKGSCDLDKLFPTHLLKVFREIHWELAF